MSAKQSSEMRHALMLVGRGMAVYKAASIAGVYPSSVYKARAKIHRKEKVDKLVA